MTTTTPQRRTTWGVPAGLIALGLVPVVAGSLRLAELGGGPQLIASGGRDYASAPGFLVAHIVAVIVYAVLGAFQFAPGFRARRRGWHRVAGRLLVVCGLVGAVSGLWLSLFQHRPEISPLLTGIRLVVGTAWVVFLVLGFTAIRRRNFVHHRAWMTRAYAIALGAGTQAFTVGGWQLAAGTPDPFTEALLMLAGWLINLAVAEWAIRRSTARRAPITASTVRTG
ncbi:DUF2306 domain-containing protein [Saccharothrix sp. NPDC042600]|uniref:DUF2306 domain-containing protein n=1 Tax=Saccharothrix TaxID=2071 RepID=UPI0033D6907A|nr:DUF2306 domain-containing protein [Saccharothrix mutabilis subsp. capreolus]